MPNGAIISPPDSSSDDDDLPEVRLQSRGRPVEPTHLHQAIGQIPQNRSASPTRSRPTERQSSLSVDVSSLPSQTNGVPQEDTDEDILRKPQMVRKKSGELVRPALRASSRRRPSSMPGTPTFSKAVHFDSHLEHVRHFLQVDRPLAVSAGSSPAENYESDTEYPFNTDDRSGSRSPPFEWEIVMNKFPVETPARKAQPVRLEKVWLSNDQKSLIGSIAVANLAFQKHVTCRFTLDYWKTTSEVAAEYSCEIRPAETPVSRDRFNFTIKLSDLANLESKTLYFCIRYNVNGQEHWDNNNGMNFQADFRKKNVPQNGKRTIGAASRPVNGLPKSSRRSNPSTVPRPKSMPAGPDEFGTSKLDFDQSIQDFLGDSETGSIRLKGIKSSSSLPSDNLSSRLSAPSGQAFANRYDFGASLTAAIQNAKDQLSDGLYMKSTKRQSSPSSNVPKVAANGPTVDAASVPKTAPAPSKPPGSPSDSPSAISSSSYEELVNKYCFFGTKSGSRLDGPDDSTKSTNSSDTSSYEGSPVQMTNYRNTHNGTQHHSMHNKASYFQYPGTFASIGASPSESPLACFAPQPLVNSFSGQPWMPPPALQSAERSSPVPSVAPFAHFTAIRG